MPVHQRDNQYRGVNAHLHSLLQREGGGWEMFHAAHITHLTDALDVILPEGYYVLNEKSLQLSVIGADYEKRSISRPDVAIYRDSTYTVSGTSLPDSTAVATIPLMDTFVEDAPLDTAVIYRIDAVDGKIPVTRIELLSPANKPAGSHYRTYMSKRQETLESGVNLVEIDYLHESRPITTALKSYPDREPNAYPYTILVNNPHPSLSEGRTTIYGFHVGDSIPVISLPLVETEALEVNLGGVYNTTFSRNRYYGMVAVDYGVEPVNFAAYDESDQTRIMERMRVVNSM